MILIISHPNDLTTDRVIKWLKFYDYTDIIRLNTLDRFKIVKLQLKPNGLVDVLLMVNGRIFSLDEVSFLWYRNNPLIFDSSKINIVNSAFIDKSLKEFYNQEWSRCRNFILHELQKKPSLGNFFHNSTNKLINLAIAAKVGFSIPVTFISEYGDELLPFVKNNKAITKPISELMSIKYHNHFVDMHTVEVSDAGISSNHLDAPALLQEKIEKWIEIRAFVLYEKIYSMAIFSQNDSQTSVDFRDYNEEKGNRMVPFNLPEEIKSKILLFMKEGNYDTGSIDLIVSKDRKWYFLEINPTGVIEMLDCCNFDIEKDIALEILTRINHET